MINHPNRHGRVKLWSLTVATAGLMAFQARASETFTFDDTSGHGVTGTLTLTLPIGTHQAAYSGDTTGVPESTNTLTLLGSSLAGLALIAPWLCQGIPGLNKNSRAGNPGSNQSTRWQGHYTIIGKN